MNSSLSKNMLFGFLETFSNKNKFFKIVFRYQELFNYILIKFQGKPLTNVME